MGNDLNFRYDIQDIADDLHKEVLAMRFPPKSMGASKYQTADESTLDFIEETADRVATIASRLDSLLANLDLTETQWVEFCGIETNEGDINEEKTKYQQQYRENNFPADEQFTPATYGDKSGK